MSIEKLVAAVANPVERAIEQFSRTRNTGGLSFFVNDEVNDPRYLPFLQLLQEAKKWCLPAKLELGATLSQTMRIPREERDRITYAKVESGFYRPGEPTIIFLGPLGLYRYQGLQNLLVGGLYPKANMVSIIPQDHTDGPSVARNVVDSLWHMQATIAGSVNMIEEVTKRAHYLDSPTAVVGMSMGGMATFWHAIAEGTADEYFPLVASPSVASIFMEGGFKQLVDRWSERMLRPEYGEAFSVKGIQSKASPAHIHPFAETGDEIVPFSFIRDDCHTLGIEVDEHPFGHIGPALQFGLVRQLITNNFV